MSKYDNLKLNQTLLKQIGNLIDGNNASSTDILEKSHEISEFNVNLNVIWNFQGEYEDSEVAGGAISKDHFGTNELEFNKFTQELLQLSKVDENLRKEFLEEILNLEANAIKESNSSKIFYEFKPFSVSYECSNCRGKGKVSCSSCGGKGTKGCSGCGGSGNIQEQQPVYKNGKYAGSRTVYRTCSSCGGSGRKTCFSCHGGGTLRCSSCGGHGYFTITRNVFATAIPSSNISVKSSEFAENLSNLLGSQSVRFCGEKIHFELIDNLKISQISHAFKYFGQSMITKLNFTLLNKDYTVAAMSNPPFAFIKPAIFDDIFADEIRYLKKINKDKKISRAEAYSFFSKYQNQPVLDLAIQEIAKVRENENDDMGKIVFKACDGYISKQTATIFANFISRCLDKISPVYSKFIWILFGILASLGLFFYTENLFENKFLKAPFGVIFDTFLAILITILSFGAMAYLLSLLVTSIKRLKIAPQYRQKMRNKEAFSYFRNSIILFGILGAIYGGFASKELIFRLEDRVEILIKSTIFKVQDKFCSSTNFKYQICNNVLFLKDLSAKFEAVEQKDKILSLQNLLIQNGFEIKADGVWGKKSNDALAKYMSEKFPHIKLENLDEIYTYLKLSKNMP